jgi:hypothetical protein
MPLSKCAHFFIEDLSSSNDSNLDEVLFDDDVKQMLVMLGAKELEDKKKKRLGSKDVQLCIPWNRALMHIMPMQDYFADLSGLFLSSSISNAAFSLCEDRHNLQGEKPVHPDCLVLARIKKYP